MMGQHLKASRYNHFVDIGDDKRLAFNALTCGLAEFDNTTFSLYKSFAENEHKAGVVEDDSVIQELTRGGFLVPQDLDELDGVRTNHYSSRFGQTGRGLTIVPTLRCNFACDYCYEDSEQRSIGDNGLIVMSEQVCQNIVNYCKESLQPRSALTVTWYGGEPMLAAKQIAVLSRDLLEVCESKECRYTAAMITNGYLLDPANIKLLREAHVSFLQITVDGPRDIHDQRRPLNSGHPTYDRIMENLSTLSNEDHLSIAIRINVDSRNKDSIGRLLLDLRDKGFHKRRNVNIYFSQVRHFANSCPDISGQCMASSNFASWMVDAHREAMSLGFMMNLYPVVQSGTCGAVGKASIVVDPDGYTQSCWNTVGNPATRTGRVTSKGLEPFPAQLKWLGWVAFRPECEACSVLPLCMGGCPYMSLYKNDSDECADSSCIWWKHNLAEMMQLLREARLRNLLAVPRVSFGKEE